MAQAVIDLPLVTVGTDLLLDPMAETVRPHDEEMILHVVADPLLLVVIDLPRLAMTVIKIMS